MTERSRAEWAQAAEQLRFPDQPYIDGGFVESASASINEVRNPATGEILVAVADSEVEDVDRAVESARAAFLDGDWPNTDPWDRKRCLLALADLIRQNSDELGLLITLENGKSISEAVREVESGARSIQYYAEAVDKVYDEVAPTSQSALALVTREPVGVVAAVIAWNYPILLAAWKIGPALATGNSVVLKPAEQTPLLALRLGELATEAGIPSGVLNVVPGGPAAGAALGRHPNVDAVSFTGSSETGRAFLGYAAESSMKRLSLECGGKSPVLVFADSPDLEFAAKEVALNIFVNQGEMCNASSRIVVEESVAADVTEMIKDNAAQWFPGDPLDPGTRMGAVIDGQQMARILGYVESGRQDGADVVSGGSQVLEETGGTYVEPTILAGVKPSARVAQEEIFGPVLSVITFKDTDEAVRIANDTSFGLAAGVFTSDITRAHTVARALRVGTVWVNCYDLSDMTVPFGGYKESGVGRDKSLHALDKYTELKTTWINLRGQGPSGGPGV